MAVQSLLGWCVALLGAGAVASLVASRRRELAGWFALAAVAAACLPLGAVVIEAFTRGVPEIDLVALDAVGARLAVAVDPLSALFLAITAVIALAAVLFSVRYMTHYPSDSVSKFYPVLLVFFAATIGVLVTVDLLFFLVFWELMTLASFFLVTFERESAASQRAGLKYFVITHAATLCMLAAVLLLWRQSGSFHFDAAREALGVMLAERPFTAHLVLLLLLIGFATKAGVLPMGDWLPDAHPVAPSGMSAVLSGALVKLGIYGLVRVFCGFLPAASGFGWGVVIALVGTGSLAVGTLTALRQHDSKRLMAFHTIGQIGYICLGLGVGVACLAEQPAVAVVALAGALFHAINHACFKACLFLGAGAVLYRTGERDMDRLGGLWHQMPATAGSTTVASLSIAGVPPFNGFASKWLIVCSCVLAGLEWPLFLLLGLIALFISLATLASFLKVLGAVFLGEAEHRWVVREVPAAMVVPQVALAGLCVFLGVLPQLPLRLIEPAVAAALPAGLPLPGGVLGGQLGLSITLDGATVASWAPLPVLAIAVVLAGLMWVLQRQGGASVREVAVWNCGEDHDSGTVRYPASSFYLPLKQAIAGIYPRLALRAPRFPPPLRRGLELDQWLYLPMARLMERVSRSTSRVHVGVPQVYLLWIVLGAILVVGLVMMAAG